MAAQHCQLKHICHQVNCVCIQKKSDKAINNDSSQDFFSVFQRYLQKEKTVDEIVTVSRLENAKKLLFRVGERYKIQFLEW
jgi:hypothetical protein